MLWLYRFFCGFLRIKISGDFPERLINKCVKNKINIWNIRYRSGCIYFSIMLSDFIRLFKIRKGFHIKTQIVRKNGFPFIKNRYKHRYGLFVGVILFFLILNFLSGFVWQIDINGNMTVSDTEIIADCKKLGIEIGTPKGKINSKTSAERLLIGNEKLAWAAFNIEGCSLCVDVTETQENIVKDANKPTNIKAAFDGRITKINVTVGNCVVKVGDTVKKGDLLVSGIIEGVNSTEFVHSQGEIYAQTKRSYTYEENFTQKIKISNNKFKNRKILMVFGIEIPLYLGKVSGKYQAGNLKTNFLINSKIPIAVYSRKFEGYTEKTVDFKKEELIGRIENKISEKIKSDGIKEYETLNVKTEQNSDILRITKEISCCENIAYQDILLFNSAN